MVKSFASDNYAGMHPKVLEAVINANHGHSQAYASDEYTSHATALFKQLLGQDIEIFFVCTGTAANVLSLSTIVNPFEGIICTDTSHINCDECGAAEHYLGSKLLVIPHVNGKITIEEIKKQLINKGDQHKVQPKVISLSQSTEMGTVYTLDELKTLSSFAHENGLLVHMDGARLSNAVASLNTTLFKITREVGIDVMTFGGTKNGMMLGEAVIFFNKNLGKNFPYIRKQGMQLVSKMRFVSAQFTALMSDNLWFKIAEHANNMAKLLANEIKKIPEIRLTRMPEANAVFATLDPKLISLLQKKYHFYVWNEMTHEVRWMTAWDTTEEDIFEFISYIKKIIHI